MPLFLKFCKQLKCMDQNTSSEADNTVAGQDNIVLLLNTKFRFLVKNKSPLNHTSWHVLPFKLLHLIRQYSFHIYPPIHA